MRTYVALLRAVNVGGYGKLAMADFREVMKKLGYRNGETYIQSGNAVFDADGSKATVAGELEAALERHTGAPVGVILRTREELGRVIAGNPFAAEAAADGSKVHVAFLAGQALPTAKPALEAIVQKYPARRDRYHLAGDAIYFHFPDGAGETKFTGKALEKAIGAMGTGRNWNTVLKLFAMTERSGEPVKQ
ncbi:DUF1697 domain-containing protein [Acidobacteria bacterium AB60]|nr:DUF1697 domain-containing protein [Acidobacteria bacterium AB60]